MLGTISSQPVLASASKGTIHKWNLSALTIEYSINPLELCRASTAPESLRLLNKRLAVFRPFPASTICKHSLSPWPWPWP